MRLLVRSALLAACAIGIWAAPAAAAPAPNPYPPTEPTIQLDLSKITLGLTKTITVSGKGAMPFSTISIELHSTPIFLGTTVADALGDWSASFTVPENVELGNHTVVATGTSGSGAPFTQSAAVTVESTGTTNAADAPTGGTTGSELVRTGANSVPWTALGAGLVLAGATAVVITRRRNAAA